MPAPAGRRGKPARQGPPAPRRGPAVLRGDPGGVRQLGPCPSPQVGEKSRTVRGLLNPVRDFLGALREIEHPPWVAIAEIERGLQEDLNTDPGDERLHLGAGQTAESGIPLPDPTQAALQALLILLPATRPAARLLESPIDPGIVGNLPTRGAPRQHRSP